MSSSPKSNSCSHKRQSAFQCPSSLRKMRAARQPFLLRQGCECGPLFRSGTGRVQPTLEAGPFRVGFPTVVRAVWRWRERRLTRYAHPRWQCRNTRSSRRACPVRSGNATVSSCTAWCFDRPEWKLPYASIPQVGTVNRTTRCVPRTRVRRAGRAAHARYLRNREHAAVRVR